jgi:hypothetical protein
MLRSVREHPYLAVATFALWGSVALVAEAAVVQRTRPAPMRDEPMPAVRPSPVADDALALAAPVKAQLVYSEPEKEIEEPGVCDYPESGRTLFGHDNKAPCWCYAGVGDIGRVRVYGDSYSACDTPVDYMNSVYRFGLPRDGAIVPLRSSMYGDWLSGQPSRLLGQAWLLGQSPYGDGESTCGDRESTYGDGESTYGDGESIYGDGESTYGDGESTYEGGESTYGDGESIYGDGELTYGDGESTYEGGESALHLRRVQDRTSLTVLLGIGDVSWGCCVLVWED